MSDILEAKVETFGISLSTNVFSKSLQKWIGSELTFVCATIKNVLMMS